MLLISGLSVWQKKLMVVNALFLLLLFFWPNCVSAKFADAKACAFA